MECPGHNVGMYNVRVQGNEGHPSGHAASSPPPLFLFSVERGKRLNSSDPRYLRTGVKPPAQDPILYVLPGIIMVKINGFQLIREGTREWNEKWLD